MSNREAYEEICKKAEDRDKMVYEIGYERREYEKKLKEIDGEIDRASDHIGSMLIGRKYAYMEFIKLLERWC